VTIDVRQGIDEPAPETVAVGVGPCGLVLDGVPTADQEGAPMLELVRDAVERTVASIPRDRRRDAELVREAVRRAVRAAVEDVWGKRPVAKVLLIKG